MNSNLSTALLSFFSTFSHVIRIYFPSIKQDLFFAHPFTKLATLTPHRAQRHALSLALNPNRLYWLYRHPKPGMLLWMRFFDSLCVSYLLVKTNLSMRCVVDLTNRCSVTRTTFQFLHSNRVLPIVVVLVLVFIITLVCMLFSDYTQKFQSVCLKHLLKIVITEYARVWVHEFVETFPNRNVECCAHQMIRSLNK